ncbi:MAG: cupredoxin domain-containing protein [bacterium]
MKRKMLFTQFLRLLFILSASSLFLQCSEENPLAPDVRGANEVWITANGFEPATLTVSAGTTVIWINKDSANHTVDSGTPNQPTNQFSSPTIRPNADFSHKFDLAGTFNYYCARTLATGKIVVN